MSRIRPLIVNLEQAVRDAVKYDDVTREDAVAAFAIAMTNLDQDCVWPMRFKGERSGG